MRFLTCSARSIRGGVFAGLAALAVFSSASPARAGLIITPTYDFSITSDPNAAAIENTIQTAINLYQSTFSDPINVTIKFQEMTTGLGQSSTTLYKISYATYLAALTADATSADDATALAHLGAGPNNPVTGSSTINVKTATLRAVGVAGNFPPIGGFDGVIGLNTSLTDIPSGGPFSLLAVVEHEIDEVLGLGSDLPGTGFLADPAPEDLYRYDGSGNRSFAPNSGNAFFSIDGTTLLAQFNNQNNGGDYGDWQSSPLPNNTPPKVQDAFATPNSHPFLAAGSVELQGLDVIGYTFAQPSAVPEPASVTLLGLGGVGLVLRAWRRKQAVA